MTHNEPESRFETLVDGQLAICEYRLEDDRMVFTHTYVPSQLRGRSIAQKLVEVALKHAMETKRRVVPACSYVEAFIARRPEFQVLVG
ncbi:MAG TPA: GNAT family N-acetyltransferase [Opitutus sp.]|nr:GNAT family N-acetyltransferase [Opitutus sp.]